MTKIANVYCPYCGNKAELVDSSEIYKHSYGMMWLCRPCEAYVGVHKNSSRFQPLGTLANKELRQLRNQVHTKFDPLWKRGSMTRNQAYAWLSKKLNISKEHCHVGMFDKHRCKLALEILKERF